MKAIFIRKRKDNLTFSIPLLFIGWHAFFFLPIPFKKKSYKNIAIKTLPHNSGGGLLLVFSSEYNLSTIIEGALEIIWSNILAAPAKPPRVSCPEPSPDGSLGISPRMEILPRLSRGTNPCWWLSFQHQAWDQETHSNLNSKQSTKWCSKYIFNTKTTLLGSLL